MFENWKKAVLSFQKRQQNNAGWSYSLQQLSPLSSNQEASINTKNLKQCPTLSIYSIGISKGTIFGKKNYLLLKFLKGIVHPAKRTDKISRISIALDWMFLMHKSQRMERNNIGHCLPSPIVLSMMRIVPLSPFKSAHSWCKSVGHGFSRYNNNGAFLRKERMRVV